MHRHPVAGRVDPTEAADAQAPGSPRFAVLGALPWPVLAALGGGIAGALDLGFAVILAHRRGVAAGHMLQSIGSGVLGRASYAMGTASELVGLACHFGIALGMAYAYFLLSRWEPWLRRHVAAGAIAYGLLLYVMMEFVIVPFSAAPFRLVVTPVGLFTSLLSHIGFVALPIAYLAAQARWPRMPDAQAA